ncbi:hypothetical protein LIER_26818 [Lithospermum erythrorhizon]|uniref:Uncharacterized protein n=1 Tax=Lithospermum erythrorhizon TaxID=34254 RepID=A0AAV3RBT5_LITER
MNSNGNDNDGALNLNNPAPGRNEDAPLNPQEPVHIGSGRTLPEMGSSHLPEMVGLIQGRTGKIVHRVLEELKERLPQLRGEAPEISSSIREKIIPILPR